MSSETSSCPKPGSFSLFELVPRARAARCLEGLEPLPENDSIPLYDVFGWRANLDDECKVDGRAFLESLRGREFGVLASTPQEAELASSVARFVMIPGDLCRQGDIIEAVSGATLLLERGAFLQPPDLLRALEKARARETWFVDAGSSFGFSDRVLDPRALALLARSGHRFGVNIPALHAPQSPEWRWRSPFGGDAGFVRPLVVTAVALGASFLVADEASLASVREALEEIGAGGLK